MPTRCGAGYTPTHDGLDTPCTGLMAPSQRPQGDIQLLVKAQPHCAQGPSKLMGHQL